MPSSQIAAVSAVSAVSSLNRSTPAAGVPSFMPQGVATPGLNLISVPHPQFYNQGGAAPVASPSPPLFTAVSSPTAEALVRYNISAIDSRFTVDLFTIFTGFVNHCDPTGANTLGKKKIINALKSYPRRQELLTVITKSALETNLREVQKSVVPTDHSIIFHEGSFESCEYDHSQLPDLSLLSRSVTMKSYSTYLPEAEFDLVCFTNDSGASTLNIIEQKKSTQHPEEVEVSLLFKANARRAQADYCFQDIPYKINGKKEFFNISSHLRGEIHPQCIRDVAKKLDVLGKQLTLISIGLRPHSTLDGLGSAVALPKTFKVKYSMFFGKELTEEDVSLMSEIYDQYVAEYPILANINFTVVHGVPPLFADEVESEKYLRQLTSDAAPYNEESFAELVRTAVNNPDF